MASHNTITSFILSASALTLGLNCTSKTPTGVQDNVAIIRLNLVYPGAGNSNRSLAKASQLAAIDRVTISVIGFDDLNERTFFYVEDQELSIDTENNVAEGTISVALGQGTPETQIINEQEVVGEQIEILIAMFEDTLVTFTGATGTFFVAPRVITDSPPIFLTNTISDLQGNPIGTVTVSPNPAVAFSLISLSVQINSNFSSRINSVFVTSLIPSGSTFSLQNDGAGFFSLNMPSNSLGQLNLQFIAIESEFTEVGSGINFVDLIVDPVATGFARNITLIGDFDIAIGEVDFDFGDGIIWTRGDPDGEIRANHLKVDDITAQPVTIWEISSIDTTLFDSPAFYGNIPFGAAQNVPPDNVIPLALAIDGRYRITVDGKQGTSGVSAQIEFTYRNSALEE